MGEDPPAVAAAPSKGSTHGRLQKNLKYSNSILECEGRHAHKMDPTSCPRLDRFINDPKTETFLSILVIYNLIIVVVETDSQAQGSEMPTWAIVSNYVLMFVFGVEIGSKMLVYHINFFKDPWCVMDFLVVWPDILLEIIGAVIDSKVGSLSFFRVLRLLRLARAVRILSWFPELFALVKGLAFAFRAIFWGTILIMLILMIWSVMAVQFVQPLMEDLAANNAWPDCHRCPAAFDSVPASMLTFIQQIVAGDSWGEVTVPIIEAYPLTSVFFVAVLVSVGLAILNLILAVIVDKADDAKQDSLRISVEKKKLEQAQARLVLKQICAEIDTDQGGHLQYDELIDGYNNHQDFQDICNDMDITLEDMNVVWAMLDTDDSGEVSYDEFVEQLYKMKNDDSHTLLVFIKFYVGDIRKNVFSQMGLLREEILVKISETHDMVEDVVRRSGFEVPVKAVKPLASGAEGSAQIPASERGCPQPPTSVEPKEVDTKGSASTARLEAELARLREVNLEVLNKISNLFLHDAAEGDSTRSQTQQAEKAVEKKRDIPSENFARTSLLETELGRLCTVNSELVTQITNLNKQYELQHGFLESVAALSPSAIAAQGGVSRNISLQSERGGSSAMVGTPPARGCGLHLCSAPPRPRIKPITSARILEDEVTVQRS